MKSRDEIARMARDYAWEAHGESRPEIRAAFSIGYEQGAKDAIEAAAEEAMNYWQRGKNVYARHAGRAVESRIRALAKKEGEK